jgi:hypothetical protein
MTTISDMITDRDELNEKIETFFEKVVRRYLTNSYKWKDSFPGKWYYHSNESGNVAGEIRIMISTSYGDYVYFEISCKILSDTNWEKYVDDVIAKENAERDERFFKIVRENEEKDKKKLAELLEKYGKPD